MSATQCKNHASTGTCRFGNSCRFSHDATPFIVPASVPAPAPSASAEAGATIFNLGSRLGVLEALVQQQQLQIQQQQLQIQHLVEAGRGAGGKSGGGGRSGSDAGKVCEHGTNCNKERCSKQHDGKSWCPSCRRMSVDRTGTMYLCALCDSRIGGGSFLNSLK